MPSLAGAKVDYLWLNAGEFLFFGKKKILLRWSPNDEVFVIVVGGEVGSKGKRGEEEKGE